MLKSIETEVGASGSVSDIAVLFRTLCGRGTKVAEEKCNGKSEETAAADVKKKSNAAEKGRQIELGEKRSNRATKLKLDLL